MLVYLIGSLTNPRVPEVAAQLRCANLKVFEDWHAAGPEADKFWQEHYKKKGMTLREALKQPFPQTALRFDLTHLDEADVGVLLMPAGKSGHSELGRMNGQGKPTFVLFEQGDPEKWDLMHGIFTDIAYSVDELLGMIRGEEMRRAYESRRVAISG